jgi:hypothetical protein
MSDAVSTTCPDVYLLGVAFDDGGTLHARVRGTNASRGPLTRELRFYISPADAPHEPLTRTLAGGALLKIAPHGACTAEVPLDTEVLSGSTSSRMRPEPPINLLRIQLEVDGPPVAYEAIVRFGRRSDDPDVRIGSLGSPAR